MAESFTLKTIPYEVKKLDLKQARLGVILQARSGSVRLPGKVHMMIGNKTLLQTILSRLLRLSSHYRVVVATSDLAADYAICEEAERYGFDYFTGSEEDVLSRYYYCAKKFGFKQIVRLTADNPFVDIDALESLVNYHLSGGYDYSQNQSVMPLGIGSEVFEFRSLEKSFKEASLPHQREHVNEYILENPSLFRIGLPSAGSNPLHEPTLRLTVDTEEDLAMARTIFNCINKSYIAADDAIRCLQELKVKKLC